MKWEYTENLEKPVKSWCEFVEDGAMKQACNLANHPSVFRHVALMPDCHQGYGMPIGGVIACTDSVIPNAVGVDIGCGMCAVETDLHVEQIKDRQLIRSLMQLVKQRVPVGEGNAHRGEQHWNGFSRHLDSIKGNIPAWYSAKRENLDKRNLGTLGGGNHFIELQSSEEGIIWLMLHSGSRNLGYRIADHYHKLALRLNDKWKITLPDRDLAFLHDDEDGKDYLRDMNFALAYAAENRKRMMKVFKESVGDVFAHVNFLQEINIHHNYASRENHFGRDVWVHRKGATSAHKNEKGIIPGSMGTSSYIVEGLGNPESFMSCSHGAGRVMGRNEACRRLSVDECNRAMDGIVFDRWSRYHGRKKTMDKLYDLSEAPGAYKNIDEVIEAQLDLIKPLVKLHPLGVVKG